MKKNVLKNVGFLILGFILGGIVMGALVSKESETKRTLDFSRSKMIELNKEYNELFNKLAYYSMAENNSYATAAAQTLQQLTPGLIELNKALKLDCKEYQENGEPLMVQDEKGSMNPLEKLPEEIRIVE